MHYDTTQDLFDALSAPFAVEMIEWRVGSTNADKTQGMALAYVDARAVMDRLDTVCGPEDWQCSYTQGVNGSIVCNLGVRVASDWVWKADGAGATDFEGEKGALSDAFKRAAVRWGIGRYLYDLKAPWVALDRGKYIPDAERKKLDDIHEDFAQKAGWGPRSGIQVYRLLKKVALYFVTDQATAQEFKETNKSEIAALPVAMRRHLFELLDRIGADQQEQAA
jgi:hypothetical protein